MKTEDYWIDMYSFYITFLTNENRKIQKLLFLASNQRDHEEISEIVKKKFRNVDKVLSIEEMDYGLALK